MSDEFISAMHGLQNGALPYTEVRYQGEASNTTISTVQPGQYVPGQYVLSVSTAFSDRTNAPKSYVK